MILIKIDSQTTFFKFNRKILTIFIYYQQSVEKWLNTAERNIKTCFGK